jgi:hypothetical protein
MLMRVLMESGVAIFLFPHFLGVFGVTRKHKSAEVAIIAGRVFVSLLF